MKSKLNVPMSPLVLYKIGLALEDGQMEPQMRKTWGDETVDWLNEAMRDPVFMAAYPPAGYEEQNGD